MSSPCFPQAALGFRSWALGEDGLHAMGYGKVVWRPGVNLAYCRHHLAPQADCSCGLYCYHSPQQALQLQRSLWMFHADQPRVLGAVACRGRVELHAAGLRAEEAVIVALALDPDQERHPQLRGQAEQMAARYGVPLVPFDQLQLLGRRYAQPVPQQLLPEPPPHSTPPQLLPPTPRQRLERGLRVAQQQRRLGLLCTLGALLALLVTWAGLLPFQAGLRASLPAPVRPGLAQLLRLEQLRPPPDWTRQVPATQQPRARSQLRALSTTQSIHRGLVALAVLTLVSPLLIMGLIASLGGHWAVLHSRHRLEQLLGPD